MNSSAASAYPLTPSHLAEIAMRAIRCLHGMWERLWALSISLRDHHLLVGVCNDVPLVVLGALFDRFGQCLGTPIFPLCSLLSWDHPLLLEEKKISK